MNSLLNMLNKATKYTPVTRQDIIAAFGVSDRKARKMIEALREDGHRVCGTASGYGYWIAKSEGEYKAFRAEYISKATTILRRAGNMDKHTEGQVEMEAEYERI